MATIAEKIVAIYNHTKAAFEKIAERGGTYDGAHTTANLADAIDTIPSGVNVDGVVFKDGASVLECLANNGIVSVIDESITQISKYAAFFGDTYLKHFEAKNIVSVSSFYAFGNCKNLTKLILPKLVSVSNTNFCRDCTNLRYVDLTMLNKTDSNFFGNNDNIICFKTGSNFDKSMNLSGWRGINAVSASSKSLVEDEETFASNKEKLLYNIRTYIAANLNPSITATITFSSYIKNAIQSNEETMAAFPSSWTIA